MRKAQISTEFVILISITTMLFIFILGLIFEEISQVNEQKRLEAINDIGEFVQNEIVTATMVDDGYTRIFVLPEEKDGVYYNITLQKNSSIIITSANIQREFIVPDVIGNITKGANKIDKLGGIVYINVI
ncbi:MAG: hypothetical protein QXK37_01530 [Candidatus Woesearchaeota archaeon]